MTGVLRQALTEARRWRAAYHMMKAQTFAVWYAGQPEDLMAALRGNHAERLRIYKKRRARRGKRGTK